MRNWNKNWLINSRDNKIINNNKYVMSVLVVKIWKLKYRLFIYKMINY